MIAPTKTLAIVGALGTTVGGGLLLSQSSLFSKPQIKTTLKNEVENDKWVFLTSSNKEEISKILEAYKFNSHTVTLRFENLTGNENNAPEKLLQICKGLYEKPSDISNKDNLLKQLKKWCVIPKTIEQKLKDLNYTSLSTEDPLGGTESQEWKQKGESHNSAEKDKFEGVGTNSDENERAKELRNHCKTVLGVNSFEEKFHDILKKVQYWCSLKIS